MLSATLTLYSVSEGNPVSFLDVGRTVIVPLTLSSTRNTSRV